MIDTKILKQARKMLDENFTKPDLEMSWYKPVKAFVKEEMTFIEKNITDKDYIDLATSKRPLSKEKMVRLVSLVLSGQTLFEKFRASLSENAAMLLDELIWVDALNNNRIEELLGFPVLEKKVNKSRHYQNTHYILDSQFRIFQTGSDNSRYYRYKNDFYYLPVSLSLPLPLRKHLLHFYETPEEAEIKPVKKIEQTAFVFEGENTILQEIPRLFAYHQQGQIKITKSGKVQTSTTGKMQKKVSITEFYPESTQKHLKNLRTTLLAGLISTTAQSGLGNKPVHKHVVELFKKYYLEKFITSQGTLFFFKNVHNLNQGYHNYSKNIQKEFTKLVKTLPLNEWVALDNLENHAKYNFYELEAVTRYGAADKLYYELKVENQRWTDSVYIDNSLYHQAVQLPIIRGSLFLFAAFGLLDIAYDTPDTEELGKTAYSPYDELKYVRLNELGAYVLGLKKDYELSVEITQSTIVLSTDSLTIIIPEKDLTGSLILEPYAARISPNRYRTDFSYFLKGVKTKTDLNNKIVLFKQAINVELPQNWEQFFKEMRQKINPLNKISNITVFEIPTDNPTLLNLIAKDDKLKKLCLKAENYHVLVTKKNMPKFKSRLQEFGYLV